MDIYLNEFPVGSGLALLEAMAAGIPVFWQKAGWLVEVNIDGVTGRFFDAETDESFQAGFLQFHREVGEGKYDDSTPLVAQAKKYDTDIFKKRFLEAVKQVMAG